MTVKEIAEKENVHIQTVRLWIKLKKLKAKQTVNGYYINEQDYETFKLKRRYKQYEPM